MTSPPDLLKGTVDRDSLPLDGLSAEELAPLRAAAASIVRRTPVFSAGSLSERVGGRVALKAESLQRTGSLKLRGAAAKLAASDGGAGVVAVGPGNHAQALAYAARAYGVPCEVFVPAGAPLSRVAALRAFEATVHTGGEPVARERAREAGMAFAHPFDDPVVVRGHATLGIELVEEVAELAAVVVPVGGGALAAGVAMAVKRHLPAVQVIGVQPAACAPLVAAPSDASTGTTIAEAVAVRQPGALTMPLLDRWVDGIVAVGEDAIADAMLLLAERAKLVVEGAGAVAVAALMTGAVPPAARGTTVALLSGGNIEAGLLATLMQWAETGSGRRLRLFTRVPDRPGGLAGLLAAVADIGANVLEVDHVRDGVARKVRETGIELTLETRGEEHADEICRTLRRAGYEVLPG